MSKKTIVICDDNDPLVVLMKHLLANEGYEVLTAADGREGLSLLRSAPADILLLDLEMPAMDGMALLDGLRAASGKRPYTIVISAHEGPDKRAAATALGAQEVWRKPFNVAQLTARLGALIEKGII